MNLLKRKPAYTLIIEYSIYPNTFYSYHSFNSLKDIKFILDSTFSHVNEISLRKGYTKYDNFDLSIDTEDITEQLQNIKLEWYELEIGTSTSNWEEFKFNKLFDLKKFLSRYSTYLGIDLKYYVKKFTKYFDKDDSYKIKQTYELLNDI